MVSGDGRPSGFGGPVCGITCGEDWVGEGPREEDEGDGPDNEDDGVCYEREARGEAVAAVEDCGEGEV